MNEYAPFYIIAFMFIFSVFIVLKAYEHQLKLKRKQAALKQLLENNDAAIH
jgi:cbb3-type cytochrome oxidase subunit 3